MLGTHSTTKMAEATWSKNTYTFTVPLDKLVIVAHTPTLFIIIVIAIVIVNFTNLYLCSH